MTTRQTIDCVFAVPAYRRVQSEEGNYESQCGYNIVAKTFDEQGMIHYWLYVGTKETADWTIPVCFGRESAADSFVNRVYEVGSICEKYCRYVNC